LTINERTESVLSSSRLEDQIAEFLDQHKAEKIITLNLRGKSVFADAMVIATGTSGRFNKSLAEKLKEFLHKLGYNDIHIEGATTCDWILIDGADVVVHLFKAEIRELYNLEKMWGSAFSPREAV
jgi:ribosome-associated protein